MKIHTNPTMEPRRRLPTDSNRSSRLASILTVLMLPAPVVPAAPPVVRTRADGNAHVSAGWNQDVQVHPEVPLTVNDSKDVTLGFRDGPGSTVTLSAAGSQTVPDVIDPGELAALPIWWTVSAEAEAGGSAAPGTLRAWAQATAAQSPTSQSYTYISPSTHLANSVTKFDPVSVAGSATALVGWDDVLTITSPTLAAGTPIDIHYTVVLDSLVQNPHGTSGATAYLLLAGTDAVVAQVSNFSGAAVNTKSGTFGSEVGKSVEFQGVLQATAHAAALADPSGPGSIGFMAAFTLAMNTGNFYFDLDSGTDAAIVSLSGTSYTTPASAPPAPALQIRSAGSEVVISWPATGQPFQLETTAQLGTGSQWLAVPNPPVVVGLQLVVSNSIAGSGGFYRLRR